MIKFLNKDSTVYSRKGLFCHKLLFYVEQSISSKQAPMQRLLRYPMLLERYKKEAELENVDKCFINEIDLAIRSIKVISGEANEAKRTTDGYANLAQIFHEIEGKNSIEKSGSKRRPQRACTQMKCP